MKFLLQFLLILCLIPASVFAHTAHGSLGFSSGLTHPIFGLDHLLAMLSVGILSVQMGGRAIWTVPLTFVCFMLVGGILGIAGIPFFSVEIGIALSVLLLGLAIAIDAKLPLILCMAGVGFFALFHGHAHGEEMPTSVAPYLYALGFVSGTALIHLLGVLLGWIVSRIPFRTAVFRLSGATLAILGIYFLVRSVSASGTTPALTSAISL